MRGLFVTSVLGLVVLPFTSGYPTSCDQVGKAIYLITNDQTNMVIALPIGSDGMLSEGTSTATGGSGSNAIDASTNQPAGPEALLSQAAVTIAGNYLFAVNAGSNTVTMFSIDTADPTKLTMTGQPAAIPGDFPNAVTASAKNNLVCVGTTGAMAGISCGSFSARGGIGKMDALRPFDLNQTTPPMGPTDTVSQAFFSLDEGTLFTTVKGNPAVNTTGFLAAFPFSRACDGSAAVGRQGVMSSPAGTAVLFGSSTLAGPTDLFVTDASFGAVVLSVDSETDVAALVGKGTIAGQVATCWVAVSPASNTAFVADAGLDRLVEMSTGNASVLGEIDLSANGDPGLIDLAAAGKYVYALSPGNGTTQAAVTVVDVETKQQVQHFQLQAEGVGKNAQGMAVLL